MRITWKDSLAVTEKSFKYRKHLISPYKDGWIVDLPDDNNIYANQYCVKNAVDLALGGNESRKSISEKRIRYGIQIIGKK